MLIIGNSLVLYNNNNVPTFTSFSVSEKDVMDVEKTYWALKSSGKFDLEALQRHICPPISEELVPG